MPDQTGSNSLLWLSVLTLGSIAGEADKLVSPVRAWRDPCKLLAKDKELGWAKMKQRQQSR
jgi:hypothetical protein